MAAETTVTKAPKQGPEAVGTPGRGSAFGKKPLKRRKRKETRGLCQTTPAYKCIRALFLVGAVLTAISYGFIHVVLVDPVLMGKLLRHPVPQGATLAVSADAYAILYGCAVFTALCFLVMALVRWRKL